MLRGGPKITAFHPRSHLERLISIIYRGTYSFKRLSDLTKVTAGERQKICLEKQKGHECHELIKVFLGEMIFNFLLGFQPSLLDL